MSELTPQEVAERLEKEASYMEAIYHQFGADGLDNGYISVLRSAASIVRQYANGELKPVVHARWVNMPFNVDNDKYGMNKYNMRIKCTNCGFVTSSDLKYAHCPVCGALMDGKDDSHETN